MTQETADLLITRHKGLSSSDATSGTMLGVCGDIIDTCDCVLLLYEHLFLWLSMQHASDKVNQYFLYPCNLMRCVEP